MNRIVYALLGVAAALVPITAAAAPSPSPTLDQVLAPAPSGFTQLTTSPLTGKFSAHDYATNSGSNTPSDIENTLNTDGFVDGYGKTWVEQSASHALVELVIAFNGGKGAQDWLTSAEAGDKTDPTYKNADTITGIPHYYGAHFASTTDNTFTDAFVFLKGNDVFAIGAASKQDDALSLAQTQTTAQFNAAPNETIPSDQWPENKTSNSSGGFGSIFYILAAIVVIAVVVLAVILRSRRRSPAPAMYGPVAGGPMMGSPPMGMTPAAAPAGVQLSEDGHFWWDGQTWRDAEKEVPPSAQRSGDGTLWWDGKNWRPVPQAQPPA